jgi:hypothetical protein
MPVLPADVRRALLKVRDRTASENELKLVIMRYALDHGWWCKHDLPARMSDGRIVTAVQGKTGFPDFIGVRDGRMVIAEFKTQKGTTSPAQDLWLPRLEQVPCVEVFVWRPSDWAQIKTVLH